MRAQLQDAYERTLALVGVTTRRDLGVVLRRDIDRFAVAVGITPAPDDVAGVAHPLYLTAVLGWSSGPPNSDLRPDGTEVLDTDAIPLAGLRLMGGGQDIECHQDVTEGTRVRAETMLEGVEIKEGRTGNLLLLRLVRTYLDEDGRRLVTCRETLMAR